MDNEDRTALAAFIVVGCSYFVIQIFCVVAGLKIWDYLSP